MAIGRLSMKAGKIGSAGPHAAYLARQGQYASRLKRGEKLEASEAGNMPAWAQSSALAFWQAADAHERKNGTTYREMEIALPRELDTGQRVALVREFVRQEIGERHAYQWAIHTPTAADGQEQPHVHLMFSERQRDGIERDPQQYFKRYNAKAPEKGGARKGYGPSAGQTLTKAQRAAELKALRGRWQQLCNAHLEQAGVEQRIDMRSHAERGSGLEPEAKQLPSQWRGQGRANVIEFRQARAELAAARAELAHAVPDARAEVVSLEAERQRLERMSAAELAREIARLRPTPMRELVERDPAVLEADRERRGLEEQHWEAQVREGRAKREAEQWRRAHPLRAKIHDAHVLRSSYLDERAEIEAEARREGRAAAAHIDTAALRGQHARSEAETRIAAEQGPARAKVEELEKLHQEKARQEREEAAKREHERQPAERVTQRLAQPRERAERPLAQMREDLPASLAQGRAIVAQQLGAQARLIEAQRDSGIYQGQVIAEVSHHLIQRISPRLAVAHPKAGLEQVEVGAHVSIAYASEKARVKPMVARGQSRGQSRGG